MHGCVLQSMKGVFIVDDYEQRLDAVRTLMSVLRPNNLCKASLNTYTLLEMITDCKLDIAIRKIALGLVIVDKIIIVDPYKEKGGLQLAMFPEFHPDNDIGQRVKKAQQSVIQQLASKLQVNLEMCLHVSGLYYKQIAAHIRIHWYKPDFYLHTDKELNLFSSSIFKFIQNLSKQYSNLHSLLNEHSSSQVSCDYAERVGEDYSCCLYPKQMMYYKINHSRDRNDTKQDQCDFAINKERKTDDAYPLGSSMKRTVGEMYKLINDLGRNMILKLKEQMDIKVFDDDYENQNRNMRGIKYFVDRVLIFEHKLSEKKLRAQILCWKEETDLKIEMWELYCLGASILGSMS